MTGLLLEISFFIYKNIIRMLIKMKKYIIKFSFVIVLH